MSFKVGDRVRVKKRFDGAYLRGKTGTIIDKGDNYEWLVEFDEPFDWGAYW